MATNQVYLCYVRHLETAEPSAHLSCLYQTLKNLIILHLVGMSDEFYVKLQRNVLRGSSEVLLFYHLSVKLTVFFNYVIFLLLFYIVERTKVQGPVDLFVLVF